MRWLMTILRLVGQPKYVRYNYFSSKEEEEFFLKFFQEPY